MPFIFSNPFLKAKVLRKGLQRRKL